MVIFIEQKSYAIIKETPEEQLMSDAELKKDCLKYLDLLKGRIFTNKSRKIQIEVGKEIKNEMWSKIHINPSKKRSLARIKLMALKAIPYFLTDSDPDSLNEPPKIFEPSKNNKTFKNDKQKNVIESHVFKYKCEINGEPFLVRIRTRQKYGTEHRLYFISLEDLELQ